MAGSRVSTTRADQCMYGLMSTKSEGSGKLGPSKKPTGFMGKSCMIEELSARCLGEHEHVHLADGKAAGAAIYRIRCVALYAEVWQDRRRMIVPTKCVLSSVPSARA